MKNLFEPIFKFLHGKDAGIVGASVGLGLGLMLIIFGFWKTLFLLFCTILGYVLGARLIRNSENFRELLDKLFPPGRFR